MMFYGTTRWGDVAHIDKVYMYGPPKWKESNPTAQGGTGNPLNIWSYILSHAKLIRHLNIR